MQEEEDLQGQLVNRTKVSHIKFSRCKCLGGMFGPLKNHNKYFFCRYIKDELDQLIDPEYMMEIFQQLYSHPVMKIQRIISFFFYSLTIYLAFYGAFLFLLVNVGLVTINDLMTKLYIQAVFYFIILVTIGISNQLIFMTQRRVVQAYVNNINREVLREKHLYITLLPDTEFYLCKYSFRSLSSIQIKRLHN